MASKEASQTSDSFWTVEKEAELVELWKSQPNLYDCSSSGYANRNQKSQSHSFIASELGTTGVVIGFILFSSKRVFIHKNMKRYK